jgi:hypothetical protein
VHVVAETALHLAVVGLVGIGSLLHIQVCRHLHDLFVALMLVTLTAALQRRLMTVQAGNVVLRVRLSKKGRGLPLR